MALLGVGLRRSAESLVRSMGAEVVQVRMPAPPVAGDDGELLGLRTPEFAVRPLWPVTVKRSAKDVVVRVPAVVLERFTGLTEPGAICAAMAAASAVVIADEAFALTDVEVVEAGGGVCLYHLVLDPNATEVV